MDKKYSIVIPAYNEEGAIEGVLREILALEPKGSFEVVVVDDCSTDTTAEKVAKHPVKLLRNVQNFGYGYSLKQGIRVATHENIIILDADGSYPVSSLSKLIQEYEKGFDMVVGARQGFYYRGSPVKRVARFFFRAISEFATGQRIPDINSGCRVFRKDFATRFFHILSNGFSFTTTITLAFMLNAYSVRYIPIEYHKRAGKSKVRYLRDTLRSAQIIVEAIVFYNPLKIFLLCAAVVFFSGLVSIALTLFSTGIALLFFGMVAGSVGVLSLGFVTVFLRFMHTDKRHG